MTYPIRVISDGDTAWGGDLRFALAGVNDHQTRLTAVEGAQNTIATNARTASYTLVLGDAGLIIEMNLGTATTLTVPPNSAAAFPVGTVIEVLRYGAGSVTLVAGAGVTLQRPTGAPLTLRVQYSGASLRKRATDEWVLAGDLG